MPERRLDPFELLADPEHAGDRLPGVQPDDRRGLAGDGADCLMPGTPWRALPDPGPARGSG